MAKAQSFILEFILFFAISFSLFTTISYFFYRQNELFSRIVGEMTTDLMNDVVSIDIVKTVNCKGCDNVLITENIPSKIGGFYYRINLTDGLNTTLISSRPISKKSLIFNLNETYDLSGESMSENKIVKIKINNTHIEVE